MIDDYKKRILQATNNYHNALSEEARSKAVCDIIDGLEGFIWMLIKKWSPQASPHEYEDMLSIAKLAIIEGIPEYDPDRATPTKFFGTRIIAAFCEDRSHDVGEYYFKKKIKITRAIREYNLDIETVSAERLANLTGESTKTIKNTLDMFRHRICSIDSFAEFTEVVMESPEKLFLEKEENQELYDAISQLDDLSRTIVYHRFFSEDPMTKKEIASMLNHPDVRKKYGIPKTQRIDSSYVSAKEYAATQQIGSYLGKRVESYTESLHLQMVYDQAETEDIDQAFMNGLIEL